jgi:predicted alpha/beta hydrolase family esterase
MLEGMPLGATESEQEHWQEKLERLQKYAAKAQKIRDDRWNTSMMV